MYKLPLAALFVVSLTACGSAAQYPSGEQRLRPIADSPAPVVDAAGMTPESIASFRMHTRQCRLLQEKAMPISLLDALGSSDVKAYERRREDQAAAIMRRCLEGRGFMVLN